MSDPDEINNMIDVAVGALARNDSILLISCMRMFGSQYVWDYAGSKIQQLGYDRDEFPEFANRI